MFSGMKAACAALVDDFQASSTNGRDCSIAYKKAVTEIQRSEVGQASKVHETCVADSVALTQAEHFQPDQAAQVGRIEIAQLPAAREVDRLEVSKRYKVDESAIADLMALAKTQRCEIVNATEV